MAEITCPACRATISDDGETVIKQSPRIARVVQLENDVKEAKQEIADLKKRIAEPAPGKKKSGFADEYFE